MIGITKQSVGHGLVISEPTIESEQNGNVKVYVAKGLIKNSTNDENGCARNSRWIQDKKWRIFASTQMVFSNPMIPLSPRAHPSHITRNSRKFPAMRIRLFLCL